VIKNEENFFDNYAETVNLNSELEAFYDFINDDELTESLLELKELICYTFRKQLSTSCSNKKEIEDGKIIFIVIIRMFFLFTFDK
jgi:hypothetical protein